MRRTEGTSRSVAAVMAGGALVLLLVVLLAAAGCGSPAGTANSSASASPAPALVGSGRFSGQGTQRVDLGVHKLGASTWVDWELDGSSDSRASFRLALRDASGQVVHAASMGPVTFAGHVVNHRALYLDGAGTYAVSLTQIVRPREAPGYVARFKVLTSQ